MMFVLYQRIRLHHPVSILVVVDVGCDADKLHIYILQVSRFNPCCGGCRM